MTAVEPKPVTLTQVANDDYTGPDPQPFAAVGGIPGTLTEDTHGPGTYLIVSGA